MVKFRFDFIIFLMVIYSSGVVAQITPELILQDSLIEQPRIKLFRAEENYDYLKEKEQRLYQEEYLDEIKLIGLNTSKSINLSLGGEFRLRMESFTNRNWEEEDQTYYAQRIAFHSNLNVTQYVRFFGELYHGLVSLEKKEFAQSEQLDWHQAFMEVKIPFGHKQLSLRFGRQEMSFGATRLVGIREGPNIRRSFDMGRAIFQTSHLKTEVFFGKEVRPLFEVFDNEFSLFTKNTQNPIIWGAYSQFAFKNDFGKTEVYYLGFESPQSAFNDAMGRDERHTLGIRRFGKLGKNLRYNSELMFQFGETGGKNSTSWAFETDWHFKISHKNWQPELGLKLDIISGDKTFGDNKIQTFNPMFTNPGFFSLAGTIAPVNLIEFHPSFSIQPLEKLNVYLEWASFFRYSNNDGVYSPPRFINRDGQVSNERFIGSQLGCKVRWEFDRYLSFDLDFSYFIAGRFLEYSGSHLNVIHIAPTISYKF